MDHNSNSFYGTLHSARKVLRTQDPLQVAPEARGQEPSEAQAGCDGPQSTRITMSPPGSFPGRSSIKSLPLGPYVVPFWDYLIGF